MNSDRQKIDYEYYGKEIIESNTTSDNVSFFIDSKKFLCQYENVHPLTARNGEWVSEIIYKDLENIIQQDSLRYITPDKNEGLSTQKLTNCEIKYYMFSCQECTKSVCLDIQNKMNVLES